MTLLQTKKTLVVAGAGVVGLAVARAAARVAGMEVVVIEANTRVGMETSSRNSEVVHAGIYYPRDSHKARLCVRGRELLYAFCDTYDVPHQRCGKLIVAQRHQSEQLHAIAQRGAANGVNDLQLVSRVDAQRVEPHVECDSALFSPSTGIVDSHALMQTLQGDAEAHGAAFAFAMSVASVQYDAQQRCVRLVATNADASESYEMECDYFVNATGMFAPRLLCASSSPQSILNAENVPQVPTLFAKGTYFKIRDNARPFRHLVYPIPEVGGLGVHATVDLEGNVRFGPDVEWVSSVDYTPDPSKAEVFAERIRPYWPQVSAANLVADYCGIRPKITIDGKLFDDFFIAGERTHGIKGVVHLCGIESPGLTSSLAIAESVLELLQN